MEQTARLKQAVKDYREGKAEAFTPLYEESKKYIYTCIYKVMSGNDNAQDIISDIMQDTYVEISKSIEQLENEDRFLQWAGMIATRKCYAHLKKNKKYVLLNEEDRTFDNLSDSESIIPEEVMQDREKQRLVREIINTQLTEMQKLCVIAFYYNEQKQSEIAQELGIPENTVKTNLSRAKAKIKDGVVDLEKKQGTKLYSVAPFLLLLFKEEVQAMVVPKQVTESVLSAVSASVSTTVSAGAAKGILSKIASASVKTKIISGIVAVGVMGVVGGTVLVASQANESMAVVSNQETEPSVENIETVETELTENKSETEEVETEETKELVLEEYEYSFEDRSVHIIGKPVLDEALFEDYIKEVHLADSVDLYLDENLKIGYTKPDMDFYTRAKWNDWYEIQVGDRVRLVKIDEFEAAIAEEVVEESTKDNEVVAETPDETPVPEPATPEADIPVEETPSVEETPVVDDSKYTPEEAIAAYRGYLETNGMTWDPSIKEFASWGTGWIDLNDPIEQAKRALEGYQYGDGAGNSHMTYYIEVTDSDENSVYVTAWNCE